MKGDKKILSVSSPVLKEYVGRPWHVEVTVTYENDVKRRLKFYTGLKKCTSDEERRVNGALLITSVNALVAEWLQGNTILKRRSSDIQNKLYQIYNSKKHLWRPKTCEAYRTRIWQFSEWCEDKNIYSIKDITSDIADKYVIEHLTSGKSPSTVNNSVIFLNLLLQKCECKAFSEIKLLRRTPTSRMYFAGEQIAMLKENIMKKDPNLWLAVQILYYCFIRPSELRYLKVGDINFHQKSITVNATIAKNKRTQTVAIPDKLMSCPLFKSVIDKPADLYIFGKWHEPADVVTGRDVLYRRHNRILKDLGFDTKRYSLYSWKHTGAVMFYKATKDIKALQMQLRHHSLDMTNEYLKNLGIMDFESVQNEFPAI